MNIDLANLREYDIKDLQKAQKQIEKEIQSRAKKDYLAERRKMEKQLQKLADTMGMKLVSEEGEEAEEVPKAIYRNPNDPSQVWRGGGRKPKWVKELEATGYDLETLKEEA